MRSDAAPSQIRGSWCRSLAAVGACSPISAISCISSTRYIPTFTSPKPFDLVQELVLTLQARYRAGKACDENPQMY